ncbi:GNAT family N-acetyltransferase [Sporosarcina beigongshangi]|uniref:GNAT family N-acetyltransferase n=1 Tax=Sporosarcina beigongshangi TaxID=2782538 RepID=UPI001939E415|nr:GNAT family N-acetyltransferase [Sporosarcina beigongshangi]
MSNIYIKDIDDTNEWLFRKITLKMGQEKYIESVDECIEEASTYHQWRPVALYDGEVIIGFAMYGSFGPNKDTWIDRIMIDEKYQGKGLGRKAMLKLIEIVSKEYGVKMIYLSIIEENKVAFELYKSIGFEFINERDPNGELIFKYVIN